MASPCRFMKDGMLKRILFSGILLINSALAMNESDPEGSSQDNVIEHQSSLEKFKARSMKNVRQACSTINNKVANSPYIVGIKIINTSKLYSLRITGGTLDQTIELNPVIDDGQNEPQYDVQYLLLNCMSSINIQTFRPGSGIANETQFRRLKGQDVIVINVDRIPNSKKFYAPIIMIDPYSIKEARNLYPKLNL